MYINSPSLICTRVAGVLEPMTIIIIRIFILINLTLILLLIRIYIDIKMMSVSITTVLPDCQSYRELSDCLEPGGH